MIKAGTIKPYEVAFTLDLKDDFFIHAVLLKATYFYPYDIYIGSDPDWSKNQKFTGYGNCENSANYDCTVASIRETWVNVEGRYITFYAKLEERGVHRDTPFDLEALGVFGNKYGREKTLPNQVVLEQGTSKSIDIPNISPLLKIGNTMDVRLRQPYSNTKNWVTIDSSHTKIWLQLNQDATVGQHKVMLESFDSSGGIQSTLRTDVIFVTVQDLSPKIEGNEALSQFNFITNKDKTITLPPVEEGKYEPAWAEF